MRVDTTVPAEGTEFDWDIAEIMERDSCDVCSDYGDDWEIALDGKRMDSNYEDVLTSIKRWGFLRPLTAYVGTDGLLHFGDGHHRLAAAIDLGMTTVPVRVYEDTHIAEDSGEWDLRDKKMRTKKYIKSVEVYC